MKPRQLLFSCEHAVNDIPPDFAPYFSQHQEVLNTHRGIDFGALEVAQHLSRAFSLELYAASVSRLLIECNRSLSHSACFSEISTAFSQEEKNRLIQDYYLPYRQRVTRQIQAYVDAGFQVWHLSIHSFTPEWNGVARKADIGLLYDPKRPAERAMARQWQTLLKPSALTRLNYPYRGDSDGFTTSLRKEFADEDYIGIEVEINQALTRNQKRLEDVMALLTITLAELS